MIFLLPVLHVTGLLTAGLGLAMLLPAIVDVAADNPDWQIFAATALLTWTLGTLMALATRRPDTMRMTVRQAFLMTATVWIALSAFSALPFLALGLDFDDALFEAVSGFTTTGSTVIVGLDRLPPGLLLWRALLQWIGGVGIVVMAIIILPFLRVGGMQLFHTESSDRSEKIVPRPVELVGYIVSVYIALTVACAVSYMIAGMAPFDAVCHAMTTLSTGGFANYDASMGHFQSAQIEWFAVVFMLAGAFPFVAYIKMLKRESFSLWRDPQIRVLMTLVVAISLVLGVWVARSQGMAVADGVRLAAFHVVSIVTTTGYASTDYLQWGAPAVALFFLLTFVGGCTGSTAGGIKIYRFQVLWATVKAHVQRLVRPSRLVILRFGGRRLPEDVPASVLAFLAVYIGTAALFTLLLAMTGLDFVTAISSAATAIGNVGPGLGPIVGPAGNFTTVPDPAKWVLTAAMLLGRLELFTLIVMLDPEFWRG
ncbi:TrkH family potassium uptake protein [Microbaculum sp. FT89]|uniref:TrkH family potassium uptake protein n=1 Tax=Microbaculum sp. FT89 TaxID=3447298 RepID=UPI003F53B8EC